MASRDKILLDTDVVLDQELACTSRGGSVTSFYDW
jgi:hypothetical protein